MKYKNIGRGLYDAFTVVSNDEIKQGYPNALRVENSVKTAADKVVRLNNKVVA